MSDLIPSPDGPLTPTSVSRTDFQPEKATDSPGVWRKFIEDISRRFRCKSPELAERFSEAEVRKREQEARSLEVENEIKLMKAKQECELIQAETRRQEAVAQGQKEIAKAEARKINAEARTEEAMARIAELAAREMKRRSESLEDAQRRLDRIRDVIRSLGGDVEIPLPDGFLPGPGESEGDLPDSSG